jgi:MFS family permease
MELGAEDAECSWEYTGLGMDYQLLVGPAFMAVFTVGSILWGLVADREDIDRLHLLVVSSLTFSTALVLTAFAQTYWQLVGLRMLSALG